MSVSIINVKVKRCEQRSTKAPVSTRCLDTPRTGLLPSPLHLAQTSSVPQENLEKELYKAAVCCISLASSSSYISELNIVPMTGVHARLYPPTQTRINLELVARQNKMQKHNHSKFAEKELHLISRKYHIA